MNIANGILFKDKHFPIDSIYTVISLLLFKINTLFRTTGKGYVWK